MRFPTVQFAAALAALLVSFVAFAQGAASPAPAEAKPADAKSADPKPADTKPAEAAPEPLSMESLSWLAGCWRGTANQREFREHWLPLRGNLIVGASHSVAQDKTQNISYLRIEPRPDGVYYVVAPVRQPDVAFRLTGQESDGPDRIFTFTGSSTTFPQRIVYRRGSEGWLYVHVEGKLGGEERRIIYPFRRVDCESGELLRQ